MIGFPITASAAITAHDTPLVGNATFFRVVTHSPTSHGSLQPPRVLSTSPTDLSTGVPRNSTLTINLTDPFLIRSSSIQLTVGNLGTYSISDAQLLFTDKLIFNPFNAIPLGDFGETVPITLTVANAAGTTTVTWTITLEQLTISSYFSTFQYIPHRGIPMLYAEDTMDAFRASVAAGALVVEADCQLLMDGNVGIMHDTTVDRTTTSTGATTLYDTTSWRNLAVDASNFLGGGATDTSPPLLDDILSEFGNKIILMLEPKVSGAGLPIVKKLQQHNVRPDMVIINSFLPSELTHAKAAGYPTILNLPAYTGTPLPSQLAAAGYYGVSTHVTTDVKQMDALRAAGLKVIPYTAQTHAVINALRGHCDAIYADDPFYMEGTWRRTIDPFSTQTWYPGMQSNNSSPSSRGAFYPPNLWGVDASDTGAWKGILQGWACPLGGGKADHGTITYSVGFDRTYLGDNSRFAWIAVMNSDRPLTSDAPLNERAGYTFLARKNGVLEIYKYYFDGAAWTYKSMGTTTSAPISTNATARYKVSITETNLTFSRLDTPASLSVNDASVRGVFLHGGTKGLFAKFSSISVDFED